MIGFPWLWSRARLSPLAVRWWAQAGRAPHGTRRAVREPGQWGCGRYVRSPHVLPVKQVLTSASQSDLTPVRISAAAAAAWQECAGSAGKEGAFSLPLVTVPRREPWCRLQWASLGAWLSHHVPLVLSDQLGRQGIDPSSQWQPQEAPRVQPRHLTLPSQHTSGPARVRAFPGTAVPLPTTALPHPRGFPEGLSWCCLPRQTCIQADPALVTWCRPHTLAYTWSQLSYLKGPNIS